MRDRILHYFGIASLNLLESDSSALSERLAKLEHLIDLRHEEVIDLDAEFTQMKLKIDNLRQSFDLKMEQVTNSPITNHEPISLKPPSWKRQQRHLERQSYERAVILRREIAEDLANKGAQ